jgi:hypothetical protein
MKEQSDNSFYLALAEERLKLNEVRNSEEINKMYAP